jgi:hypothetical protein
MYASRRGRSISMERLRDMLVSGRPAFCMNSTCSGPLAVIV